MGQPTQQEVDQVRATTQQIAERAQNDAAFKQQLQDDPQGTLQAAGLPEAAIAELGKKAGDDVSGYAYTGDGYCAYYTDDTYGCNYYTV